MFHVNKRKNIVVSGKFGLYVKRLIELGELDSPASFLLLTGDLRHNENIEVLYQRGFINRRNFTFIDDSFYKGRTAKAANIFLNQYGSKVDSIVVAYDGSREKPDNLTSLFRYFGSKYAP